MIFLDPSGTECTCLEGYFFFSSTRNGLKKRHSKTIFWKKNLVVWPFMDHKERNPDLWPTSCCGLRLMKQGDKKGTAWQSMQLLPSALWKSLADMMLTPPRTRAQPLISPLILSVDWHQGWAGEGTYLSLSWDLLCISYCCSLSCVPLFMTLWTTACQASLSVLHITWPKYWSFRLSISPSNEYSGLISLRIDWFDLLDVQRSFKSLL